MKLAHPIFSVSGISAPAGGQRWGGGLQDGVPPPSLITYSRPSRASRPRGGLPPSPFGHPPPSWSNLRFSSSYLSPLSPPRNSLTTYFVSSVHLYHSPLFFEKKILIESRDVRAFSLSLRDVSSRLSSSPSHHRSFALSRIANHPPHSHHSLYA